MEAWRQWLRIITTLIILMGFFEMLIPENDLKKLTKLVMGLVIMLAILQPILAVVHWNWDPQFYLSDTGATTTMIDWSSESLRIHSAGVKPVLHLVESSVTKQLESLLVLNEGIQDATIDLELGRDGQITGVVAYLYLPQEFDLVTPIQVAQSDEQNASSCNDSNSERVASIRASIARYLQISDDMIVVTVEHDQEGGAYAR